MLKVVVVGAGIAGLTTAAALARAGITCQVYEQTVSLGEVGAGIQVTPNATRLLNRLESIRLADRAVAPSAIEMRRWDDGVVLGRTVLGETCLERYGAPYYVFHRADLHKCLLDLMPPGVVTLGRRVAGVRETVNGAEVSFADGSVETADVVIGADGIRSVVRTLFKADAPRFSGHAVYRGLIPADVVPHLVADPKVTLWTGPGRHCVVYPVAAGEVVNVVATLPTTGSPAESWTEPGNVADMLAGYAGWHPDVQMLLSNIKTVTQWALHDRDPLDRWSGERVTLVGDAAHPMLPFAAQGANQAIEDAFVLAECLREADKGAVPAALKRYESLRRSRAAEVQQRARNNERQYHLSDTERQPDDGEKSLLALAAQYDYDAEAVAAAS